MSAFLSIGLVFVILAGVVSLLWVFSRVERWFCAECHDCGLKFEAEPDVETKDMQLCYDCYQARQVRMARLDAKIAQSKQGEVKIES